MSSVQSNTETDVDVEDGTDPGDPVHGPESGIRAKIIDSALLKLSLLGVVFVLIAVFFDSGLVLPTGDGSLYSIWAAIFGIWGVALIVAGLVGYGIVWWRRD